MVKIIFGISLVILIGCIFYFMYLIKDFFNDDDERL